MSGREYAGSTPYRSPAQAYVRPQSEIASSVRTSWNPHQFVRLETHSPLWMRKTVIDRGRGVGDTIGTIHGLQPKVLETKTCQLVRIEPLLGIDELKFIAAVHPQRRTSHRADTHPIETARYFAGAIRLDRSLKAASVNSGEHGTIELQQGLPARENDKSPGLNVPPGQLDCVGEVCGVIKFATTGP